MLIMIILIISTIVGLILTIVYYKNYLLNEEHLLLSLTALIPLIFGGGILLICSIAIICTQSSLSKKQLKNKLDQTILSLNATRTMLIQENINDNSIIEITNYNTKVAEFKKDIVDNKMSRNNIWINWFVSGTYDSYTGDEVEYIKA